MFIYTRRVRTTGAYLGYFHLVSCKLKEFQNMIEREFRVLIQLGSINGKSPQVSKEIVEKNYGESRSWIRTINKWFQNCRKGYMSTSDAKGYGRPVDYSINH